MYLLNISIMIGLLRMYMERARKITRPQTWGQWICCATGLYIYWPIFNIGPVNHRIISLSCSWVQQAYCEWYVLYCCVLYCKIYVYVAIKILLPVLCSDVM